jgi:hypothetical protein
MERSGSMLPKTKGQVDLTGAALVVVDLEVDFLDTPFRIPATGTILNPRLNIMV